MAYAFEKPPNAYSCQFAGCDVEPNSFDSSLSHFPQKPETASAAKLGQSRRLPVLLLIQGHFKL